MRPRGFLLAVKLLEDKLRFVILGFSLPQGHSISFLKNVAFNVVFLCGALRLLFLGIPQRNPTFLGRGAWKTQG